MDSVDRFMAKVQKTDGCWLWIGAAIPRGYGRFFYRGKPRYAHRVALELLGGQEVSDASLVMHACDNPACVNPEHLTVGTQTDNMRDAAAKGRTVNPADWRGPKNPRAKLSAEQRGRLETALLNDEGSTKNLAAEFMISRTRVQQIARELRDMGVLP